MLRKFIEKNIKDTYNYYPGKYWVLVGSTFVDRLGGTMLYPFFTLYVTRKFNVGMTEAGVLLAVLALSGMVGGFIGGALSDRFGRKGILLTGLVFSGLSSLAMGVCPSLSLFFLLAVVAGLLGDLGGPARMVMVADLLPEEKRASGYGMMRVAGNLAWVAGPSIGGLLAIKSYFNIFLADAVTSLITAVIVFIKLPETLSKSGDDNKHESVFKTVKGYGRVFSDRFYMAYILVSILMLVVYQQLYSSFAVYLRDVHGYSPRFYGLLMSLNAFIVVILQFRVSRWVENKKPMIMMALGTLTFLIGYTLFGFIHGYVLFALVAVLITFGEMIVIPVSQALVARLSPGDMRGRYMGIFNLSWTLPSMIGPYLAGVIMDNFNPNLLWYLSGFISVVAMIGFLFLSSKGQDRIGGGNR